MRVLVTGANGFLGIHICRQAKEQGWEAAAFILKGTPRKSLDQLGIPVFEGDLLYPDSMQNAFEGQEIVFHTAGLTDEWLADPSLIFRVNVDGTRNVCKLALRSGVRRVLCTSSAVACGSAPKGGLADEESPWDLSKTGPYSVSKHEAEQVVREFSRQGLDVVILCPHQIIGPGDHKPSTPGKTIIEVINRRSPFYVNVESQFVGVQDVARAHITAAQKGRSGQRYILAGPEPVSMKAFFNELSRLAGTRPPKVALPLWILFIVACITHAISHLITRRPPLMTVGNARLLYKRMVFSTRRAAQDLDFAPQSYEIPLKQAVDWFRDNGRLKLTRG
jgi:dihydroflavonol-4-reductase